MRILVVYSDAVEERNRGIDATPPDRRRDLSAILAICRVALRINDLKTATRRSARRGRRPLKLPAPLVAPTLESNAQQKEVQFESSRVLAGCPRPVSKVSTALVNGVFTCGYQS